MDREKIEVYAAGGSKLRNAYAGVTPAELMAIPIPGTWTLQQIAVHMMESDLIATDRMKRVASMERPLLIGYDETAFSQLPGVNDLDIEEVLSLFELNRKLTATFLRKLSDNHFARIGIHNEVGKLTLADLVVNYIEHLEGHLQWVAKKVAMLR